MIGKKNKFILRNCDTVSNTDLFMREQSQRQINPNAVESVLAW